MTAKRILRVAAEQSARELGCDPDDFFRPENAVVPSGIRAGARVYLEQPLSAHLVSYGANVVACALPEAACGVREYLSRHRPEHCFETPAIGELDDLFRASGARVRHMAEYFLPDPRKISPPACAFEVRLLRPEDFAELYLPEWGNALCAKRRERDVLAAGAYDGGTLVGLAGCSADCADMWQIGIDVAPAFRRRGIAAALTSRLAAETLERGKVPFYCAAWANLGSVKNALRCGFYPAWTELTVK